MTTIVQITDTHLFKDKKGELLGVPTDDALLHVLDAVRSRCPEMELCLLTGDLAQDAQPETYQRLAGYIEGLGVPVYAIPGNHDDLPTMLANLSTERIVVGESVRIGSWYIAMIDSTVPGEDYGSLNAGAAARLLQELSDHADLHTIVVLHHPPVLLGSAWLDELSLRGKETLLQILAEQPQVKAVIWGHAHQSYENAYDGMRMIGTPATCLQFLPHSDKFGIDNRPPGFRIMELGDDGVLRTHVEWLDDYPIRARADSRGY